MALYLLECTYCGYSWKIDYIPSKYTSCTKCKDRKNLTVKDLSNSIDYYAGTVPHKDEDKTKDIILEDPPKDEKDSSDDEMYPFLKTWD